MKLYSFAARDIQRYIFRTGKLKEIVGASEIVNLVCDDFLKKSLNELAPDKDYEIVANAAGWAKIIFCSDESAETFSETFYKYWPFLTSTFAPGLRIVHSLVDMKDRATFMAALRESQTDESNDTNNIPAQLPEIGSLIARNPRTGLAAVDYDEDKKERDKETKQKLNIFKDSSSLARKLFKNESDINNFAIHMSDISGGEQNYVAVIHADGNAMGQNLVELADWLRKSSNNIDPVETYRKFSKTVDDATIQAAQMAFSEVVEKRFANADKKFPMRPIVIGGDDLTVVIRAELAFDFTATFLKEFEKRSADLIKNNLPGFPVKKFTSCAGIAFVKTAYPFYKAYDLAESICAFAKKEAKKQITQNSELTPSCFAFHRVSASIAGEYKEIQEKELTGADGIKLWFGPYSVGNDNALAKFSDLRKLASAMDGMPSGTMRQLIATIYDKQNDAINDYNRMIQIAKQKKNESLDKFTTALKALTGKDKFFSDYDKTPLLDAHRMRELCKKILTKETTDVPA